MEFPKGKFLRQTQLKRERVRMRGDGVAGENWRPSLSKRFDAIPKDSRVISMTIHGGSSPSTTTRRVRSRRKLCTSNAVYGERVSLYANFSSIGETR